ncbi:MAG: PQQ-dependent sugar dehydrogenase [bacterium]
MNTEPMTPRRPRTYGCGKILPSLAVVLGLVWFGVGCRSTAPVANAQAKVSLRRVLPETSFRRPVHLAGVPDGSGDLVVVEQEGVIRRFDPGARRGSRIFLDIRGRVATGGGEEGLLSVAFHPAYRKNRRFYVYYSAHRPRRSVIAGFRAPFSGQGAADPSLGSALLEVSQPFSNHNGGQLAFGPDGMLYIGLGDGGAGGDPHGNGQNPRTLLGAILRIDVDRRDAGKRYAVPPDNPFASSAAGRRGEIWAYGLRNPWRFSFDRATGNLYAADVGQGSLEEVDRIVKGGNYGWNTMEGTSCFRPSGGCQKGGMIPPISQYGRSMGRSITGGFVYRGKAIQQLRGHYLFADYSSGLLWSIPAQGRGLRKPRLLLRTGLAVSSFGTGSQGELYLLDHGGGGIHQLVPAR